MRILFEVLERDRFEIFDPCIPAGAETAKIIAGTEGYDTVRILQFDPTTLHISDITPELYDEYRGPYDQSAPLWVKQQPDFDLRCDEEARETREWQKHVRSFSVAA